MLYVIIRYQKVFKTVLEEKRRVPPSKPRQSNTRTTTEILWHWSYQEPEQSLSSVSVSVLCYYYVCVNRIWNWVACEENEMVVVVVWCLSLCNNLQIFTSLERKYSTLQWFFSQDTTLHLMIVRRQRMRTLSVCITLHYPN